MTRKFTFLILALFALISGPGWGQTTITLTQSALGLGSSYSTNTEKEVNGITYIYTDLMKSNENIQAKASTGTIRNKTAYSGNITSVAITHFGTARATTILGSSDGTNFSQVATGNGSITADFSDKEYKYFKITRGSNAAYWTKIEITYSTGSSTDPSITINPAEITWDNSPINVQLSKTITVSQANLTSDITIASTIGTVSPSTIAAGEDATNVTLTYTPTTIGDFEGEITFTSGETSETVTVSGSAYNPSQVDTYIKVNSIADLTADDVFIIVGNNGSDYAMSNNNGTSSAPAAVAVTVTDDVITNPASTILWTIGGNATDGYIFYPYGSTTTWLYCINENNGVRVGDNTNKTFTMDASGYLKHNGQSRYIGIYNSQDWRCYTSINSNIESQAFAFYKKANSSSVATPTFTPAAGIYDEPQNVTIECETTGATIYYTLDSTDPTNQSYEYTSEIEISETTTIKAIAYLNGEASEIATAEYEIVELYTITVDPSVFGEVTTYPADRAAAGTEVTIIISSIEEHYHVKEIHVYDGYAQEIYVDDNGKFIMPESLVGVSVIFEEDQQCNISYYCNGSFDDSEIVYAGPIGELREPSELNFPEGFTFAGWSTSMASTTAINESYNVTADTDLFAIFARVEGGSGEATAALTNSDITGSSLTNSYSNFSITNTYGTWSGNGCKQGNLSGDGMYFLQLRNNATTTSYLKLPVFPGNITSIVCEQVCNTTKDQYTGNIYFRTEADNNADAIVTATSNEALDNVTLNIPSGYNTGYIMVSAACRIYSFTVTYQSGVTKYYTRVYSDSPTIESTTEITDPSVIPSGATLTVYGLTNHNAANLVIDDGGQLVMYNSETDGPVLATVRKNITGYGAENTQTRDGYYLVANPTAINAYGEEDEYDVLEGCSQFDLYTFDPTAELEWFNIGHTGQKVIFERNVGYLYANAQDMTLHFRGYLLPTNEPTSIALVYYTDGEAGREFPGFNLIGNPYTCNAYVNGYNFYTMVDGEFVINEGSATVAPCEGFFVEATGIEQFVSLSTEAPEAPASTLSLTVSQNRGNVIDRAIVNFNGNSNLHKFMMNPAHTNIRLAKNGEEFAAISSEAQGELPVNFKAEKNGSYTITVNTENVEAQYLHLIDNKTGMDTDLLSSSSYTFEAKTSDYASRFKLVFSMTGVEENASTSSVDFAYMSNGNLVIDNIEGEATLQIVDELGRIISTETVSGSYNKALNLKAGLYIINLNGMTQKIIVK